MIVKRPQIERAIDRPTPDIRLYLLYGPDESSSRALAARLGAAVGGGAERIDLTGAECRADPARLADEAAAISLFGDPRWIRVEPAGDEALAAVEALLEAPVAGNPVALVAGALRKDAKLVKLATAHPAIAAFCSYAPEGADADRLAAALAREAGLTVRPDVARRLAAATGGDRALLAQEIAKLALYADAAPDRPGEIDHDALDALGAGIEEGDLGRLTGAVLSGRVEAIDGEMAALAAEGIEGVPVARALLRRLLLLADLRGRMAEGESASAVMAGAGKAIFWKERDEVQAQLQRWSPAALARAIERLGEAERALKVSGSIGALALDEELLTIARQAARMR
ncbi:MAG: DNA polymerase III subunit delta [Sphingomonas fennica]